MDVELQIIKHLAREAQPTVSVIDEYCQGYKDLFPEVRSYECFKYLHLGIIAPIPRKSLPEIAKIVGIRSAQSLHHFLANSPWSEESETRYIREIIFGKRSSRTYWEITTDPERMPEASTSFVMTNLTEKRSEIKKTLGNLYGLRTWVEYGFRQCKQELGWTDYRLTDFQDIEKWWEIIFCVYLMISLNSEVFRSLSQCTPREFESQKTTADLSTHQQWNQKEGWKNVLNNLRLIIQPTIILGLIAPWLDVFPDRYLLLGFHKLIQNINQSQFYFPNG